MAGVAIADMMKTLQTERAHTRKEVKKLDKVILTIRELSSTNSKPTRNGRSRRMSATARRKIAKPQKLRWERWRKQRAARG